MSEPCVFIKIDREGRGFHPIEALPFAVTAATIHINYGSRDPVTVDIKAAGNTELEVIAGVRYIEIDGRKFRLVEVCNICGKDTDQYGICDSCEEDHEKSE